MSKTTIDIDNHTPNPWREPSGLGAATASSAPVSVTWGNFATEPRGLFLVDRRWEDRDEGGQGGRGAERCVVIDAQRSWADNRMSRLQLVNLVAQGTSPTAHLREIVIQTIEGDNVSLCRLSPEATDALIAAVEFWRREHEEQIAAEHEYARAIADSAAHSDPRDLPY